MRISYSRRQFRCLPFLSFPLRTTAVVSVIFELLFCAPASPVGTCVSHLVSHDHSELQTRMPHPAWSHSPRIASHRLLVAWTRQCCVTLVSTQRYRLPRGHNIHPIGETPYVPNHTWSSRTKHCFGQAP